MSGHFPDPTAPGAPQPEPANRGKKGKSARQEAAKAAAEARQASSSAAEPSSAASPRVSRPAADSEDSELPIFYHSPRPLDRVKDASAHLSRPTDFRFAAGTNAIPILMDEFPLAAAYYPIVFTEGPDPIPAVVVGLESDTNSFIDRKGHWLAGVYMPAYVRRYPFILMDDPENKQFVLCIDEDSNLVGEKGDFPLFENGAPSEFTKNAIQFCAILRRQGEMTDAFVKALIEQDLLVPYNSSITLPDKSALDLGGFLVIDPQRFNTLADSIILDWRNKGWLNFIYAQLISIHRWQTLADLLREQG